MNPSGGTLPDTGLVGEAAAPGPTDPAAGRPVADAWPADGSRLPTTSTHGDGPNGDLPPGDGESSGDDSCADQRRLAQELTPIVARARAIHDRLAADHRHLQHEYDDAVARMEVAMHEGDRRRILEEKDAAQRRFREARLAARDAADAEEAAARWLDTINQLNRRTRAAQRVVAAERRQTTRLVAEIEAAAAREDAARIALESAEQRQQQVREVLAECEELRAARRSAARIAGEPPGTHAPREPWPAIDREPPGEPEREQLEHVTARRPGMLARIVGGDESLLKGVAAQLAGESLEEQRRWVIELATLRDAIQAAAIEAAAIELPDHGPFWSEFSPLERHQVAEALSSLGYRYDGRGGFVDDRIPSVRDLALAVGYAGLDPRRVRRWPAATELPLLFRSARVAADAFLAAGAPELTLGEMVALLGRHAPDLAPLWNQWGRVRPLLLEDN
ncbi:MAG: hypothetical protein ACP5VP_08750 [Candidatus Limnocylindrales bacterium]